MRFKIFILIVILCLIYGGMIFPDKGSSVDLSDELLKVKFPKVFYPFGDSGFGAFDIGDKQLKFFDWQFNIIMTMPLLMGEAPGEIKIRLQSVCATDSNIYLIGKDEPKLKIYNKSGSYIKSLPMDILPNDMIAYNKKLYIFNMRFTAKKKDPVLCKVFSTKSGQFENDIILKEDLHLEKAYEGDIEMVGRSSRFDISANTIYLLNGAAGVLIEINRDGKVTRRRNLPYPHKTEIKKDENVVIINNIDTYLSMKLLGNDLYTTFSRNMGKNQKEGYNIYKTHVIKIPAKGEFSERILDGEFVFIGAHHGILYLFNFDDYTTEALPIGK